MSGSIGRDRVVPAPTGELDEDGFPIYDVVDESSNGQFLGNAGSASSSTSYRPPAAAPPRRRPPPQPSSPAARPLELPCPRTAARPAVLGMAALILLSVAACGAAAPSPTGSPLASPPVASVSTGPTVAPTHSAAATPARRWPWFSSRRPSSTSLAATTWSGSPRGTTPCGSPATASSSASTRPTTR